MSLSVDELLESFDVLIESCCVVHGRNNNRLFVYNWEH